MKLKHSFEFRIAFLLFTFIFFFQGFYICWCIEVDVWIKVFFSRRSQMKYSIKVLLCFYVRLYSYFNKNLLISFSDANEGLFLQWTIDKVINIKISY